VFTFLGQTHLMIRWMDMGLGRIVAEALAAGPVA
jgi:hypothetical protein